MQKVEAEPTRIVTLINAALTATLAVFSVLELITVEVAGALGFALAAWVLVIGEFLRGRVTPTAAPKLTSEEIQKVTVYNG